MNKYLLPALLCLLFAGSPLIAEDAVEVQTPTVVKLGAGFDYSRGDYGFTQVTEVFMVPLNLSLDKDRWSYKATLPYIAIIGPASVVTGSGGATSGAPPRPTSQKESGVGDVMLSATYHARPVPGGLNVDLTGRVKFGTADEEKGLGTGETDYYAQVDLYQNFGVITPFATFGYRMLGSNAMFPLEDGWYATAGAAFRVSAKTVVGAAYDWRSRIIDGAENGTDALAFISMNPNDRWNVLAYVLVGFNDASPETGVGGALTYRF
jgi:hypothetical protein